jgi:hypothetical protein
MSRFFTLGGEFMEEEIIDFIKQDLILIILSFARCSDTTVSTVAVRAMGGIIALDCTNLHKFALEQGLLNIFEKIL